MSGLQDLLILRELQDQADPFRSALQSLATGVGQGLEDAREEQKKKRALNEQNARVLKLADKFQGNNTNARKMDVSLQQDLVTGEVKAVARTESSATRATRIKNEREVKKAEDFQAGIQAGMATEELGRRFPDRISEIKELEELGIIAPGFSSAQARGIRTVNVDGTVDTTTRLARGVSPADSVITELTPQGRPKKVISRSGLTTEAKIKATGKVLEEQRKAGVKGVANFGRVKSASIGMVAAAKRMTKEQGGFGLVQALGGKLKRAVAKSGLVKVKPEAAQAGAAELRGQTREMVLALSPILTDQNRVIQGVIEMLSETIPQPGVATTGTEFTAQLKQTTKNAFRLSYALSAGALTEGEIDDLNSGASQKVIVSTMRKIMNRASIADEADALFEEQWQGISSTPASVAEDIFLDSKDAPLIINNVIRN